MGLLAFFAGNGILALAMVPTIAEIFEIVGAEPNFNRPLEMPSFTRISEALPLAFTLAIPGIVVAALASAIGPHPRGDVDLHVGHRFGGHATVSDRGGYVDMRYRQDSHTQVIHLNLVALDEIASIRAAIAHLRLPAPARKEIEHYLADAERELSGKQPNLSQVGDRLPRATQVMGQVGTFAQAGGELVPRLMHLGLVLGNAGSTLLQPGSGRRSSPGTATGGGHGTDPDLRQRRIASMEAVAAVLWSPPPAAVVGGLMPAVSAAEATDLFELAFKLPI